LDEAGSPPDPANAATAAEYVAALARLRRWSGLTYRQLAAKTGGALPPSTMAGVLGRTTLPREDFVVAFVTACGLDEAQIDRWVRARRNLAAGVAGESAPVARKPGPRADVPAGAAPEPAAETPAAEPSAPQEPRRTARAAARRWWPAFVAAAGVAAVLVTALTIPGGAGETSEGQASAGRAVSGPTSDGLRDGWYRMSPVHVIDRDLCIGEGRERSGRTDRPLAVQRPCADLTPDTYLKAVGAGVYEIQWHHPEHGVGCLTVDQAHVGDRTLLAPADCTEAAHQRFLLEPERAGRGYVLRPVHSGKCVGLLYGEADVHSGAELAQQTCSGRRDQIFRFEPADRPDWLETD